MILLILLPLLAILTASVVNDGWKRLSYDLHEAHPGKVIPLVLEAEAILTFTGCACAGDRIDYELDGRTIPGATHLCKAALCPDTIDWATYGCNVDWGTCIGHINLAPGNHEVKAVLVPGNHSIGEVFFRVDSLCRTPRSKPQTDAKEGDDFDEIPCCKLNGPCNESLSY